LYASVSATRSLEALNDQPERTFAATDILPPLSGSAQSTGSWPGGSNGSDNAFDDNDGARAGGKCTPILCLRHRPLRPRIASRGLDRAFWPRAQPVCCDSLTRLASGRCKDLGLPTFNLKAPTRTTATAIRRTHPTRTRPQTPPPTRRATPTPTRRPQPVMTSPARHVSDYS
jgi:hypothetical protein